MRLPNSVKEYIINNHANKKNNEISKEIKELYNFNMTLRQVACFKYRNNLKSGLYIGKVKKICKKCGKRKVEYTTYTPPLNIKYFMDKWIYREYDTDLILKICTNIGK